MTEAPKKKSTKTPAENRRALTMPRSYLVGQPMSEPRRIGADPEAENPADAAMRGEAPISDAAGLGADDSARFDEVLAIIERARTRAAKSVNRELIDMYFQIGRYVSEKVDQGSWGQSVVSEFARHVQRRYHGISGFSPQNVWRMRQFYQTYAEDKTLSPLVRETTWTNNLLIMARAQSDEAKEFYLRLCAAEQLTKRELERHLDSMLFERWVVGQHVNDTTIQRHPQLAALRDSYVLEFLDLPPSHTEKDLQAAIVAHLRDFVLEFGRDFSFLGQDYRLQVGGSDFFVDLLCYHRELRCLVAIELKIGHFKPEYIGQLDFYLEALDRDVKKSAENPSVGIVLCSSKDDTVVEYALSRTLSPALVAEYQLRLPDPAVLQGKLRELRDSMQHEEDL